MSQKQHDEPLDAPTPPGGPQRTDAPSGGTTPGQPGVPGSESDTDDHPDRPDEQSHKRSDQREEDR